MVIIIVYQHFKRLWPPWFVMQRLSNFYSTYYNIIRLEYLGGGLAGCHVNFPLVIYFCLVLHYTQKTSRHLQSVLIFWSRNVARKKFGWGWFRFRSVLHYIFVVGYSSTVLGFYWSNAFIYGDLYPVKPTNRPTPCMLRSLLILWCILVLSNTLLIRFMNSMCCIFNCFHSD